ncbi:MAG TPA: radical SAM protein [Thermoanaerobaculia bacterium]|nr:radical SAM protein [Thermoanaerobaculia bacterium]
MTAAPERIDVFLRKGFGGRAAAAAPPAPGEGGCGEVVRYRLGDDLAAIRAQLLDGAARRVFFLDDAVALDADGWRRVLEAAAAWRDAPALSFWTPALRSVLGLAAGAEACPAAAALLPSWLCLAGRDVLRASEAALACRTPEFALLALGRELAAAGRPALLLGGLEPRFDPRAWAGELVFHRREALRADYADWRRRHPTAAVPPQFRLESHSRFVSAPPARNGEPAAAFPRFSVVCPVFKPDFLADMVRSVRDQTWPHWELLLAVDGPPPAAAARIRAILADFADLRIVCTWQENRGTGPTRRSLAERAGGDFVVTIDDDDVLLPDALAVFAAAARRHPEARCFRAGARIVGLVAEELPPRKRYLIDGIPNDPLEITQPYAVARATLAEVGGYEWDEDLHRAGEDTILFHQLDRAGIETCLLDRALYLRRLSTKNLTLRFEVDEALAHFRNLETRFCPPAWRRVERRFQLRGNFQRAVTVFAGAERGPEVVCSTDFFQYQTLGDLSDVTIDLEVTSACNAVCGFCPREVMPDRKRYLDLEVVERLADELRGEPKRWQVVLCGIGESTLHPQLDRIVSTLAEAGAFVAMTTNGELLTPRRFEELAALGLGSFNFSLNAATAETHRRVMKLKRFDRIVANLEEILELRRRAWPQVRVHVSFVVCTANQHEVAAFVEYWRPRGPSQIWLHPVNNRAGLLGAEIKSASLEGFAAAYRGDPLVAVDIFRDHAEEDNLCKIARSLMFISADGEMRLCAMDYRRQTSYGNLRQKSLQQMHFEKLLGYVRGEQRDFCRGCDFCPARERDDAPRGLAIWPGTGHGMDDLPLVAAPRP